MRSILLVGALVCAHTASAAMILSVDDLNLAGPAIGGSTSQYLHVGWESTMAYANVTIRAKMWSNGLPNTATAWLTQQVGPGAQPGSELASNNVTLPSFAQADYVTLFSGVTLAPGKWYVVMSAAPTQDAATMAWQNGDWTPEVGTGVTFVGTGLTAGQWANQNFAPASTWGTYPSLNIQVRGDEVPGPAVPEPLSMALMGTGLAVIGFMRVRRSGRDSRQVQ